ncbi:MAG: prolyl oligopeptidase family serine peptidase [Planctomycetota bacterium]
MAPSALAAFVLCSCVLPPSSADSLDSTRAALDAARARVAAQVAAFHDPVGPRTWIDGSRLWYAETARDGARRWWLCDASREHADSRAPLFDHAAVAAVLGGAIAADRLPVRGVSVDGSRVAIALEGRDEAVVCALGGAVIAESDPSARVLLETSLRPGKRRSRGQGASTHLVFVNRLTEPVDIAWIDRGMAERPYGRIEPGATRRQQTFGGHAWFVRTAAGRELGHVVATDVERTVAIGDPPPAEPEPVDTLDGQKDAPEPAARPATPAPLPRPDIARDGANLVFRLDGTEFFRTTDGSERDAYDAHWLSPAGDAVLALKIRRAPPRPVHIVEPAPKDQLQPKLRTLNYTKPGDDIDRPAPRLFRIDRASGRATARELPLDAALFPTPWSIDRIRFLPGGREAAFLYNARGHQTVRLVAVDLATGATRAIAEERSPTFVDYTNKIWMHWLDETGELLWMTERTGTSQLLLIDTATGAVKREVTRGPALVRRVDYVDPRARTIDLALMGHDPAQDPYHIHHARVAIDSGDIVMLTSGDGTCRVDFSPARSALISVRARADLPPVYELRRARDGAVVARLGAADDSAMRAAGWTAPERFVAKGRDGTTDIWGLVFRPSGFDPARRYPVIENIYAGPHGQHVPKWFDLSSRSREYAELGAIVVQIDGMGTNWRGKAFHDLCWKNLKDAGFPDRIAWLRAFAAREPAADLARVGIFGGSAGGQNAMRAVLDHADFYRVAVADCGCHDNRMDKIWWNEQWMGWPVDESYADNSNMEHASRLGGALMLVVGALDENVDPASTMQVAQKLIEAGKDFELLVMPDTGHGAAETAYGNARRAQFLFEHLGGPR